MKKLLICFTMVAAAISTVADEFGEWKFVPSEKLLTNKVWKLNAGISNEDRGDLFIGKTTSGNREKHAAYTGIGSGKLDLTGTITDDTGKEWKIRRINGDSFGGNAAEHVCTVTEIIFPTTMTSFDGKMFYVQSPATTQLKKIVAIQPEVTTTTIGGAIFSGAIEEAIFKFPNALYLNGNSEVFSDHGSVDILNGFNVSEWDFSSLRVVGKNTFIGLKYCGELKFPKIEHVGPNAFRNNSNLNYMFLGTDGCTVTNIGKLAIDGMNSAKKIVIAGSLDGWTIENKLFDGVASNLKLVLPTVPYTVVNGENGDSAFGKVIPEKRMCFYVPTNLVQWAKKLEGKVSPIPEGTDLSAYGDEPPFGIVDASVFGTGNPQYIGFTSLNGYGLDGVMTFKVWNPSSEGDTITATVNGEPIESGAAFPPFTEVTLTATCSERNTFVRWDGLPDDIISGSATNLTVTFMTDGKNINVSLVSAPGWTYYPATDTTHGIISNKVWKLNCYPVDKTDSQGRTELLYIGKVPVSAGRAWHSAYANTQEEIENGLGFGDLDLSGRIFDENGTEWYINGFVMCAFSCRNGDDAPFCSYYGCDHVARVTSFVFPKTVEYLGGGGQLLNFASAPGGSIITNVVMDLPFYSDAKGLGGGPAIKSTKLESLVLKVPLVKKIDGSGGTFFDAAVSGMDVSDWDLRSVEVFGIEIFKGGHTFLGTLHLPSVTYFNTNAFTNANLPELELGMKYGPKDNAKLTFAKEAFCNNGTLNKMVFGAYKSIVVETDAFRYSRQIRELAFYGQCPGKNALDGILQDVPELSASSPAIIRASSRMPGWKDVVSDDYTQEEEDALGLVDEEVLGVYVTKDGVRKAWIVDMKSPHDPKGTVLIFR